MAKPKNWDSMTPSEQEAWLLRKREQCLNRVRKYREANREKVREADRKSYKANPNKKREHSRKWEKANPEKAREACRKRVIKFRQKSRQQTAADQFFILAGAAESISKLKLKSE